MSSKYVYVLISETCKHFILYGRKDITEVIKLRILRWEDYAGLSQWAQYHHKGPHREKGKTVREKDKMTKVQLRLMQMLELGLQTKECG